MKKVVLLDVSAIMYRAFYSLMNMRNSKKEPTGAVYGFTNILLSVKETFEPDLIEACFDVSRSTLKRKEAYAEYKENREAMPEDLLSQLSKIEKLLDLFGINKYKKDGYEADDLLGTLSKIYDEQGFEVVIVTGDKDMSQLLSDRINIALPGKTTDEKFRMIRTPDDVLEQLGVYPEQIPDLFGLMGDASDGIPGIKGVGPKTAVKLINDYGTLEKVYDNIESISGKMKEKIIEGREMAFLSRQLAVIDRNVPIESNSGNSIGGINTAELFEFFKELEFKSLIKKMGLEEIQPAERDLFSDLGNFESVQAKDEIPKEIVYNGTKTLILPEEVNKALSGGVYALFDGKSGLALSDGVNCYYVPLSHSYLGAVNFNKDELKKILVDKKIITYDIKDLKKNGYEEIETSFDVLLGGYLTHPEEVESLERLVKRLLNEDNPEFNDLFGKTEPGHVDIEKYADYAGKRAMYLFHMKAVIEEILEKEELAGLFNDVEMKLSKVLYSMEKEGIRVDCGYLKSYGIRLGKKIGVLEEEIYELAGSKFNINSTKQLAEILFEKMGILPVKKTKTGFSTDVEVLEILDERGIEIASKILLYRQYTKLLSTYVDALPKLVDSNSRIHTTFHQNGTATGRLSSSDPNLQNIPAKTDEGMLIRKAFCGSNETVLISADYSQIELRVLAELTNDKTLVSAYQNGLDLHDLTARKIFAIPESESVAREQRIAAKIVNFSIIYGKTPFGLAKEIKITPGEAKEYIEKYFAEYSGVKEFINSTIKSCEMNGYVRTILGRKREIEGINSQNKNIKQAAERMAVNTVVQGSAADIIKLAMINLHDKLKEHGDEIKMLLQVHDELVFEVKKECAAKYMEIIREVMENPIKLERVKLETNVKCGNSWDEIK